MAKKYAGIKDLTLALSTKEDITKKEAEKRVKSFIDILEKQLTREDLDGVQFIDFITLERVKREARKGRNPKKPTKEVIIPPRLDIKAKVGKSLHEKLNM